MQTDDNSSIINGLFKDQLMNRRQFLYFCNESYVGDQKRLNVTEEFLDAAEKDELIVPLATEELVDGEKNVTTEKYYSPHQLFLATGLRKNIVKENRLSSAEQMVWGPGNYRTILWGESYGYTVDADTGKPIEKTLSMYDVPSVADNFHKFVKLLHTQPLHNRYDYIDYDKRRDFTMAPEIRFNLSQLGKKPAATMKEFDLNIEQLNTLRASIANIATKIDPLEYWYDYVNRHPQFRKDKFKGDALLAQELYITERIVSDVVEMFSGKKQRSMNEFLYEGARFKPYLIPEVSYANGTDAKAFQHCIDETKKWLEVPKNLLTAPDGAVDRLTAIDLELKEFTKLYGDRSYLSGVPRPVDMDNIPLDDLDNETRRFAEEDLSDIPLEDPNYQQEYEMAVGQAISARLTFMRSDIWTAIDRIRAGLVEGKRIAERDYQNAQFITMPEDERNSLFIESKKWEERLNEFSKVFNDYSLVYCQNCRENPVELHYENGDQQVSHDPLCDACFKKIADGALEMTREDWRKTHDGEWRCDYCVDPNSGESPVLYKFAQRNVISLQSVSQVPVKIQLDYGQVTLEAKCKKCGTKQRRKVDWGWVA